LGWQLDAAEPLAIGIGTQVSTSDMNVDLARGNSPPRPPACRSTLPVVVQGDLSRDLRCDLWTKSITSFSAGLRASLNISADTMVLPGYPFKEVVECNFLAHQGPQTNIMRRECRAIPKDGSFLAAGAARRE